MGLTVDVPNGSGIPRTASAVVMFDPGTGAAVGGSGSPMPIADYGVSIAARGNTITTGGTSAYAAIPNTYAGEAPNAIRLACTVACYARLGRPSEASAAMSTAGSGYAAAEALTVVGGTYSTAMQLAVATMAVASAPTVNAAGTAYIPAQTIDLLVTGSTSSVKAVVTVATTKVVSATVQAGGTGDLGAGAGVIVEGTTGTGTKFRASVTIAGNAIASVQSISLAGSYTVNPTAISAEPVTYISGAASGTTLTGAALAVVMGVGTVTLTTPGTYTVGGTVATQNATSGSGTGATFSGMLFGVKTVTVTDPGSYTVDPTNPVATTSTGSGTGAEFNVTMITAAAAGDILVTPNQSITVNAVGFDHVSAIQVTAAGVLVISPIEN